jgi:hypothetical protein
MGKKKEDLIEYWLSVKYYLRIFNLVLLFIDKS